MFWLFVTLNGITDQTNATLQCIFFVCIHLVLIMSCLQEKCFTETLIIYIYIYTHVIKKSKLYKKLIRLRQLLN